MTNGDRKKKVMISQPMRGKTEEQIREERADVERRLLADGFEVVDTFIFEEVPTDSDVAMFYLGKSIELMSTVDIVYFMQGWHKARGCMIEHAVCQQYGKQTMYNIYENDNMYDFYTGLKKLLAEAENDERYNKGYQDGYNQGYLAGAMERI